MPKNTIGYRGHADIYDNTFQPAQAGDVVVFTQSPERRADTVYVEPGGSLSLPLIVDGKEVSFVQCLALNEPPPPFNPATFAWRIAPYGLTLFVLLLVIGALRSYGEIPAPRPIHSGLEGLHEKDEE